MKKLIKLSAILCFVLVVSSCEKDRERIEILPLSENTSSFKDEADDDVLIATVPTIYGQLFLTSQQMQAGVTVNLLGIDVTYDITTNVDYQGNYVFYNVVVGTYKRIVYVGGILNDTDTYIVSN